MLKDVDQSCRNPRAKILELLRGIFMNQPKQMQSKRQRQTDAKQAPVQVWLFWFPFLSQQQNAMAASKQGRASPLFTYRGTLLFAPPLV